VLDSVELRRATSQLVEIGEAAPGTKAESELAAMLAESFERLGLAVEVQKFGCASWQEESSFLAIDGKKVEAVAMPPSPSGYIEGEIVHVGAGRELSLKGIEGKIALVGMTPEDPDFVAAQYARLAAAGASAVVFYDFSPRLLRRIVVGIFASYSDGPGLPPPIPALAISGEDGRRLARGRHYAQIEVKARYTESATSANIIAHGGGEARVLLTAHYDRWLVGAADDAVGVALLQLLPKLLGELRGVGYVVFGAEEFGAPGYSAWYWAWGSRRFVERLKSSGELNELVGVLNVDVPARRPLTVSASGPELREAARGFFGGSFRYELDSPYFDSFSFSSAGVPALTLHSLWRYVDLYHTNGDVPEAIDWEAAARAGEAMALLARELAEKGRSFLRYEAWREELQALLARAAKYMPPPAVLVELVEALRVEEGVAGELRRRVLAAVCEGDPLEPGIPSCRAFPQFLIVDDLEAIDRFLEGGAGIAELAKLKKRWTLREVRELPAAAVGYLIPLLARAGQENAREYLKRASKALASWIERSYAETLELLRELSDTAATLG
jgi:Iap family predicted aminopeptidase